jgi:hypothetical protein
MTKTMHRTKTKLSLIATLLILFIGIYGCQQKSPQETIVVSTRTSTPTYTSTPTQTQTPTPTHTSTPANTITPLPSDTPTITPSPFPSLSPTPSSTIAPLQPAELFDYTDLNGKTVDWSYIHVTYVDYDRLGQIDDLWAFVSFQLLDRGIHQRNFEFMGEKITVYYLNVAHEFDGKLLPMQLVLGGTAGANIPIQDLPADGSAYIQVQVRDSSEDFEPYVTHRDANRAFELRDESYPLLFLQELQALLPSLPDEIILLADHPIFFPKDDWPQIKLDMVRVSYLAARNQPFFEIDPYDRLVDQSDFAYALRDHIFNQAPMPEDYYAYSSQTLIIIKND